MNKIITNPFPFLYLLLFASFSFGQLTRLDTLISLPITFLDLSTILILGAFLLHHKPAIHKPHLPLHTKPLLLFAVYASFSLLINLFSHPYSSYTYLYFVRWLIQISLLFITYHLLRQKLLRRDQLHQLLITSFSTIAAIGFIQYILFPDTRILFFLGWDDHLNRLTFPFLDPNFTGLILGMGLIYLYFSAKFIRIFILIPIALLLTYSRSTYLALTLTFFLLAIIKSKLKAFALGLIVFSLAIFLLPRTAGEGVKLERLYSVRARITSIKSGFQVLSNAPVIGIGLNNYPHYKSQNPHLPDHVSSPDNSLLFVAITTGIIGLCLFVAWHLQLLQWSFKHSHFLLAILTFWHLHAIFNNSLFYSPANSLAMILIGHTLATHKKQS